MGVGINETKEGLGLNRTEYFCISESIIMDHMGRDVGGERGMYDERGWRGNLMDKNIKS